MAKEFEASWTRTTASSEGLYTDAGHCDEGATTTRSHCALRCAARSSQRAGRRSQFRQRLWWRVHDETRGRSYATHAPINIRKQKRRILHLCSIACLSGNCASSAAANAQSRNHFLDQAMIEQGSTWINSLRLMTFEKKVRARTLRRLVLLRCARSERPEETPKLNLLPV